MECQIIVDFDDHVLGTLSHLKIGGSGCKELGETAQIPLFLSFPFLLEWDLLLPRAFREAPSIIFSNCLMEGHPSAVISYSWGSWNYPNCMRGVIGLNKRSSVKLNQISRDLNRKPITKPRWSQDWNSYGTSFLPLWCWDKFCIKISFYYSIIFPRLPHSSLILLTNF